MNSQGSSYLALWKEPAPGAVCVRSGRFPIFISRFAMRGNMGYELANFPESSLIQPNPESKTCLKGPSVTSSVESSSVGPPAIAAGGDENGREENKKISLPQNYDWLKDLNEVTSFDERNIGHDHLFRVEEERHKLTSGRMRDGGEDRFPRAMQAETHKGDHVRDRTRVRVAPKTFNHEAAWMSDDLDDSLVDFVVPDDLDTTPVVRDIPRMISNNLATGPKHYQEERDVGGNGDSTKITRTDGMGNPKEDQNKNDNICREFRLKAKLDNQLDSYMALRDGNGNGRFFSCENSSIPKNT